MLHHATFVVSVIGVDSPPSLPLLQAHPLVPLLALLLPPSLLPLLALRPFLGSLSIVVRLALVGSVGAPIHPVGIGVHVVVVLGRGLGGSPVAFGSASSSFVAFFRIVQSDAPFVTIVAVPDAFIFAASSVLAAAVLLVLLAVLLALRVVHDQLGTASAHPPASDLLLLPSLLVHFLGPVLPLVRLALLPPPLFFRLVPGRREWYRHRGAKVQYHAKGVRQARLDAPVARLSHPARLDVLVAAEEIAPEDSEGEGLADRGTQQQDARDALAEEHSVDLAAFHDEEEDRERSAGGGDVGSDLGGHFRAVVVVDDEGIVGLAFAVLVFEGFQSDPVGILVAGDGGDEVAGGHH